MQSHAIFRVMTSRRALLALLVLLACAAAAHARPRVSVNMVDLLWNYVGASPNNASHSREIMAAACSRGFTFIRFAGTAYWPISMQPWINNEPAWMALFDELVADAGRAGCTLMPSFLWNPFVFSDLAGQPFQQLLNTSSLSRSYLFGYIATVVARYANNPTIVAWELWNELTDLADVNQDNATDYCAPPLGTPAHRTRQDNFSTDDLIALQRDLAANIRAIDTMRRPISSGNDIPRSNAENMRATYHDSHQNYKPDTRDQFIKNIADVNAHVDWACVHLYPGEGDRFGITDPNSPELMLIAASAAAAAGKPLYFGEFGDADPGPRPFSSNVLSALAGTTLVPLATIWIWEFYQYNTTTASPYSLLPGRDDAFIGVLQRFNNASSASPALPDW
eukprot:m.17037 g.17037  ORF g.17037 m.17037 type:complete len:393 (+) comp3201_c0_seq1:43-1221(+)